MAICFLGGGGASTHLWEKGWKELEGWVGQGECSPLGGGGLLPVGMFDVGRRRGVCVCVI